MQVDFPPKTILCAMAAAVLLVSCAERLQTNRGNSSEAPHWVKPSKPAFASQKMPELGTKIVSFETSEGTWMNVDVSPNGAVLTFDLLGDIYRLPIDGGEAVALTTGRAWDQAPKFSPDGKSIYFVSDREGAKNVWRFMLSDRSLHKVTDSNSDIVGTLNWSPDGSQLLIGSTYDDLEVILQYIDPNDGGMTPIDAPSGLWFDWVALEPLRQRASVYSGVQSVDNQVYFDWARYDELERMIIQLYKFDLNSKTRTAITPLGASYADYKPQLSHAGSLLAYFRQYKDRTTEVRILDRTTGHDRALIQLANTEDASYSTSEETRPNYAFTPNDQQLIFWHGGKIRRVDIDDGTSDIIPFSAQVVRKVWERVQPAVQTIEELGEAQIIRWPSLSRDGETMTFAAIGYVWVMDVKKDEIRRLTNSNDFEFMPAISPDGKSVAYISFAQIENDNGYGSGRLVVANIDGSELRDLLVDPNETYFLPHWSKDGEKIALIRETKNNSGIDAAFGWTPILNGAFNKVASAPSSQEYSSLSIYARTVSFDETGRNLLFSFPTSRTEVMLSTASLDGGSYRTLAVGTTDVGGITPSPNLKSLVLTRRDGTVWVIPLETSEEPIEVSTSAPKARRISNIGGYYVVWNGPNEITFGFGQNVYRYSLDGFGPEALTVKVAYERDTAKQLIAFQGARLITMSDNGGLGNVIDSGTIVLDGRRIAAVGSLTDVAIPSGALVINATGKTVMPGFLDTHYHSIGGSSPSAFKLPGPDFSDRSAVAFGITTAWEPGGPLDDGAPATADLREAGRIEGPRWSYSASGSVGYPYEYLNTYADALAAAERHKKLGVAVLKEYNTPLREHRQWLSAAARELNLGIVSHVDHFDSMMTSIIDGYTGGEHPYIPVPFYRDVHELFRQTGYIWTPNFVITTSNMGGYRDARRYFWREVFEKRPDALDRLAALMSPDSAFSVDLTKPSTPYEIHRVSRVAEQAALAAKDGVHIGVSAHDMPGAKLHGEMWYLWKGGMPIEDVLRAATIGNAKKLGLQQEIGSLEPGKIADFLVLDENPLDDIINTLSIKYTVQGGVVYEAATAGRVELINVP